MDWAQNQGFPPHISHSLTVYGRSPGNCLKPFRWPGRLLQIQTTPLWVDPRNVPGLAPSEGGKLACN